MNMPSSAKGSTGGRSSAENGNEMSGMAGMSGMSGTARMPDSASVKLQRLVAGLLEDPVVRQRIQSDSVLRDRWRDSGVRKILTAP
ncbi:MAG: hypothetical protein M3Z05_11945 [Gemmatimonadota bacterium]|nr:hypothetical protein [Gemmatimonadota bacterium]